MFETMKINDKIKRRLTEVLDEFKDFSDTKDLKEYAEHATQIIRMTCCSICQILHGHMRDEISHDDAVTLLRNFISDETRVNKLMDLTKENTKCWYEPIKNILQEITINEIDTCVSNPENNIHTVVNRALTVKLFNLGNPDVKKELDSITEQLSGMVHSEQKPIIDHCGQHMHGPNYNCKESVHTDVFPNPVPITPPHAVPGYIDPSTLPGVMSPDKIIHRAENALNIISGHDQNTIRVSAKNIAENLTDQSSVKVNIPLRINENREIIKNFCNFPLDTPPEIVESIIDKLSNNINYKHFTRLVNELMVKKYDVYIVDENNFTLSAVNADKTMRSVLEVHHNNFRVYSEPINTFISNQPSQQEQLNNYYRDMKAAMGGN